MTNRTHITVRPIPIKDRASILFLEHGKIDVLNSAFVITDREGSQIQIPIGGLTCLMLEPGTRISHAAVVLAARVGCLLVWVGEAGVRLYAAGQPGGARADKLLYQARLAIDDDARLRVVREMYRRRFDEDAPSRRSVDQLRGLEGVRVREAYRTLADRYGVAWAGRHYDAGDWRKADIPNQCLSAANACLYGLSEAAILAAGYMPAIGFLHRGKPQSFVYDIADLFKFDTVVPAAFEAAGKIQSGETDIPIDRRVRLTCRDHFRSSGLLDRIIPTIHAVLGAGGVAPPQDAPEAAEPAIELEETLADDGHRG
jgi:CRISPR-associated protein Cas1